MKLKPVIIVALLACCSVKCADEKTLNKNAELIKSFVSQADTASYSGDKIPLRLCSMLPQRGYAIVYKMNKDCSICVYDFLYFANAAAEAKLDIPILLFTESDFANTAIYYLEESKLQDSVDITVIGCEKDELDNIRNIHAGLLYNGHFLKNFPPLLSDEN